MSNHDGTAAGSKIATERRKPFVVEIWNPRSLTFSPKRGSRFATIEEAKMFAGRFVDESVQIVTFNADSKPVVVWEATN